jgi:hypothetical protein
MRALILLHMLILLIGCQGNEMAEYLGITDPYSVDAYIDPEFIPFVSIFIHEAEVRDVSVRDKIGDIRITFDLYLEGSNAGVCYKVGDTREIVISREHWDVFSASQREFVISHELGHCILGRDHMHKSEKISFMNHMVPAYLNALSSGKIKFLYNELFREQ